MGLYFNCTGGAAGYLDLKIFGPHHIWGGPTCRALYHTGPYDPEGALGCLTSSFLCFLGLQAGRTLIAFKGNWARMTRWIIWGIFFCSLGALLCEAEQNGGWIPVNKNLWSASFIFVMVNILVMTFALIKHLFKGRNRIFGTFFILFSN